MLCGTKALQPVPVNPSVSENEYKIEWTCICCIHEPDTGRDETIPLNEKVLEIPGDSGNLKLRADKENIIITPFS